MRFAGCNLRCPFCDTDFSEYREMSAEDIVETIKVFPTRFVVLTGGEPSLQVDDALVSALHDAGFTIAVETNGTRLLPEGIDWVTVSPKQPLDKAPLPQIDSGRVDEIKVVFDGNDNPVLLSVERRVLSENSDLLSVERRALSENSDTGLTPLFLQPCDVGDTQQNAEITRKCIEYIMQHPWWRLSLQTHKMANFK